MKKNNNLYNFFLSCAFDMDTIIDNNESEVILGEPSDSRVPVMVKHNENRSFYIMGTLTIPPKMLLKSKYNFDVYERETQQNQIMILYLLTQKLVLSYPDFFIRNFELNFELHKNGNIHCHFIAEINENNYRYTIHLDNLTSLWAKLVKGNKHSALFKYIDQLPDSYNNAKRYCQKDNCKFSTMDIIVTKDEDKLIF